MELLFVALAGALLGLGARYALPHRHTHGSALIPAVGVSAACLLWVGLTWAGFAWDGGWIWWITLAGTAVLVTGVDLLLGRVRTAHDEKLLASLARGAVAR